MAKKTQSKPEIVIMTGLPCSGKSTFVKNMPDAEKYKILSTDSLIAEQAKKLGKTYSEVFKDYYNEAKKIFYAQISEAIKNGQNIIVDRTNLTKKERKKLLNQSKNYKKTSVDFKIDLKTVIERNKKRSKTGKKIPITTLYDMAKRYQEPSFDEGFSKLVTVDAFGKQISVSEKKDNSNIVLKSLANSHNR